MNVTQGPQSQTARKPGGRVHEEDSTLGRGQEGGSSKRIAGEKQVLGSQTEDRRRERHRKVRRLSQRFRAGMGRQVWQEHCLVHQDSSTQWPARPNSDGPPQSEATAGTGDYAEVREAVECGY